MASLLGKWVYQGLPEKVAGHSMSFLENVQVRCFRRLEPYIAREEWIILACYFVRIEFCDSLDGGSAELSIEQ
jgi:hypothetical protein